MNLTHNFAKTEDSFKSVFDVCMRALGSLKIVRKGVIRCGVTRKTKGRRLRRQFHLMMGVSTGLPAYNVTLGDCLNCHYKSDVHASSHFKSLWYNVYNVNVKKLSLIADCHCNQLSQWWSRRNLCRRRRSQFNASTANAVLNSISIERQTDRSWLGVVKRIRNIQLLLNVAF